MELALTLLTWFMIGWCILHFSVFFLGTVANYAMIHYINSGRRLEQRMVDNVLRTARRNGVKVVSPKLLFLSIGSAIVWGPVTAVVLYGASLLAAVAFLRSVTPLADLLLLKGYKETQNLPEVEKDDFNA